MASSMDLSSIASFVEGGAGLAEIFYNTQKVKNAEADKKKLWANYPEYMIPKEYGEYSNILGRLAYGKSPGYDIAKENINQTFAESMGEAKEGALSSSQYQDTVAKANAAKMKQFSQLDYQSAQLQATAMEKFAEAKYKMGDQKALQYAINERYPWMTKMNEASSKYQEGMGGVWGGLDTFVQSGYHFADSGTSFGGSSGGSSFGAGQWG